jgi:hypothetical protein
MQARGQVLAPAAFRGVIPLFAVCRIVWQLNSSLCLVRFINCSLPVLLTEHHAMKYWGSGSIAPRIL